MPHPPVAPAGAAPPTGRPPAPRWRLVALSRAAAPSLALAGALLVPLAPGGPGRSVLTATATARAAGAAPRSGAAPGLQVSLEWAQLLGSGTEITESSPNLAYLDSSTVPSVVVGSRGSGCVYAFDLSDGRAAPGWPQCTGVSIDATPAALPAGGGLDDVVVGTGSANPDLTGPGTLYEFGPGGSILWSRSLPDVTNTDGPTPIIATGASIGDTGLGDTRIVVGPVSLSMYSLEAGTGATSAGWPVETCDATFATAAIANVDGTQRIVAASDSTGSPGSGAPCSWNGGDVRMLSASGSVLWNDPQNEVVDSSPAVGDLNGSGPVAVFGHGDYWKGSQDDAVDAVDAATGQVLWEDHLGGYTRPAPALADLLGNGQLDVVEPTWFSLGSANDTGGVVDALAPSGSLLWTWSPPVATTITGGVATADFGSGYQDVVVATGDGFAILDGRTGAQLVSGGQAVTLPGASSASNLAMENSPLVAPDPSGTGLDVVLAGTYGSQGFVADYQVSSAPNTLGEGAWPEFHHDPELTGSTIPPAPPPGSCSNAACAAQGYVLAGSDGGVFSYGAYPFEGSLPGDGVQVDDVVGIAPSADHGGYWMAGADGGVFAFGDAPFVGSMGGQRLDAPVVGIAPDPRSGGYWEVAADGGIFAFDAPFVGSMGGRPLTAPVVGMAFDPATGGYWEVAADGGVFAFDAPFLGSMGGRRLVAPVVGMAATPDGGGYWLVGADGGVFAFGDAGFFGSMGGQALDKPVVGIAPTADGGGYWEVASDGGIFSFGDAYFRGSAGGVPLSRPVVGMAATG
jgi:hypothetical protein